VNSDVKSRAVVSAGRLDNEYTHVYLKSTSLVVALTGRDITVRGQQVAGFTADMDPEKITLTRVVPEIPPGLIVGALSKYATVDSKVQNIYVFGEKDVLSFRRTVYATLRPGMQWPRFLTISVGKVNHSIAVGQGPMRCFRCGQEGHLKVRCPLNASVAESGETDPPAPAVSGAAEVGVPVAVLPAPLAVARAPEGEGGVEAVGGSPLGDPDAGGSPVGRPPRTRKKKSTTAGVAAGATGSPALAAAGSAEVGLHVAVPSAPVVSEERGAAGATGGASPGGRGAGSSPGRRSARPRSQAMTEVGGLEVVPQGEVGDGTVCPVGQAGLSERLAVSERRDLDAVGQLSGLTALEVPGDSWEGLCVPTASPSMSMEGVAELSPGRGEVFQGVGEEEDRPIRGGSLDGSPGLVRAGTKRKKKERRNTVGGLVGTSGASAARRLRREDFLTGASEVQRLHDDPSMLFDLLNEAKSRNMSLRNLLRAKKIPAARFVEEGEEYLTYGCIPLQNERSRLEGAVARAKRFPEED